MPQLFTRKFSPREPKCLNGVAVADWDGLTTGEIAPINWGYITIMPPHVLVFNDVWSAKHTFTFSSVFRELLSTS